jgi:CHAT domain-containing protein
MLDELDKGFSVVHIASHFSYNPADPAKSFLLLGDGLHLPMSVFKNSKRIFDRTALVSLSACDTAMGGDGARADGEEVEGLGYVAQKLGAQSVIASLWPVNDAGARLLMPEFYRRRKEDPSLPKAEALRLAQLSLLLGRQRAGAGLDVRGDATPEASAAADPSARPFRASPERPFEHPYYWAPFVLIGNWK